MMLIFATVFLLVAAAWSKEPETNQSTSVTSSTYVVKNLTFKLGSDVSLNCSDKTWNETIYVIWDMMLTNKICQVSFSNGANEKDSCNDGKSLRNTSRAQSYLHIPKFSPTDVGVYTCAFVYNGGKEDYEINVAITVPPTLSAWIEHGDKMVAVCKAERGKPAANISWSHSHSRASRSEETLESDGSITVESRLELDEGTDTENLTCVVRHPSWEEEKTLVAKLKDFPWRPILAGVVVSVLLVGFAIFALKKILIWRRCRQCDSSPSKSPTIEEVEEVEPYASYVQRVNSIYN